MEVRLEESRSKIRSWSTLKRYVDKNYLKGYTQYLKFKKRDIEETFLEVDPSKEKVVKAQNVVEIHLEADEGELLDDYETSLIHVEDSQSNLEKSSH